MLWWKIPEVVLQSRSIIGRCGTSYKKSTRNNYVGRLDIGQQSKTRIAACRHLRFSPYIVQAISLIQDWLTG